MGVAVLCPRDCLKEAFSDHVLISSPPMRHPKNSNSNPNKSSRARPQSNRNKRSPARSQSHSPPLRSAPAKFPSANLVMGQVKLLKRGEIMSKVVPFPVSETISKEERSDPDLASISRLGPGPESVPTQIRLAPTNRGVVGLYAGSSAFVASPPPSSVPLPVLFTKKTGASSNVDATIDLRRILRLDMA